MSELVPQIATSDEQVMACFDVMSELRPLLERDTFLATVREMQDGGFLLAYLEDNSQVVAVAGYRIARNLFLGRHLYIDDLVTTAKVRSRGYGETLYQWLKSQAKEHECHYIHLDSAVHRGDTHRFYFRQGLTISSFHFREELDD